ncbi:MAG TPA: hypothetical protein EYN67_15600 [Flavobacteriales bacterium]|nr:hypothetical protein [Flavobacteriales bacterium]
MTIDFKQLKSLVLQELGGDGSGGIAGSSAPVGVPHRMPAADPATAEQDKGDPKANELYDIALTAREATEQLVEALDEPIYDRAYEHAFRASACMRRALNELIGVGAHPMPDQHVVAAPKYQQKYIGSSGAAAAGNYAGGSTIGANFAMPMGVQEAETGDKLKGFGTKITTQSQQAKGELDRSKAIASGDALDGVDGKERGMLGQIEDLLIKVAETDDLSEYRPVIHAVLKQIVSVSAQKSKRDQNEGKSNENF